MTRLNFGRSCLGGQFRPIALRVAPALPRGRFATCSELVQPCPASRYRSLVLQRPPPPATSSHLAMELNHVPFPLPNRSAPNGYWLCVHGSRPDIMMTSPSFPTYCKWNFCSTGLVNLTCVHAYGCCAGWWHGAFLEGDFQWSSVLDRSVLDHCVLPMDTRFKL